MTMKKIWKLSWRKSIILVYKQNVTTLRDQKCKNADSLFILACYENESVLWLFFYVLCKQLCFFFLNLLKDAETPGNLTSFVVACSIGNITIRDLQEYVKITIKHTKIQVRRDWLFKRTGMQILYKRATSKLMPPILLSWPTTSVADEAAQQ